jgi:hypothetical protein
MPATGATRPFLYLPIEVASRELHAKLLLMDSHFKCNA